MKIQKNISFYIMITFIVVIIFTYLFLKNNVMISQSISYKDKLNIDEMVGFINIDSINLNRALMQGLDNNYYFTHNYLRIKDNNGEVFLDTYGDLLNKNNSIIYAKKEIINALNINDIIKILYLNNNLCYKVINNNKKFDLLIKVYDSKDIDNYYAKLIDC